VKKLCAAEGRTEPELESMLADDPRNTVQFIPVNDPIERLGRRRATQRCIPLIASRFSIRDASAPVRTDIARGVQLVPLMIASKIYRALTSSSSAARGGGDWLRNDALVSAKVALIAIDRSLDALTALSQDDEDARLDLLQAHLRRLRTAVEGRFPDARRFVRPGLDTSNA